MAPISGRSNYRYELKNATHLTQLERFVILIKLCTVRPPQQVVRFVSSGLDVIWGTFFCTGELESQSLRNKSKRFSALFPGQIQQKPSAAENAMTPEPTENGKL